MKNNFAHIKKTVKQQLETFLPQEKKRFVLGTSGGPDSVLLAHVFASLHLDFCLAHVNYQLRGKDSEKDEKFVCDLAKTLNVKYFVKTIDTKKIKAKGQSVQMFARELRYVFFDEVLQQQKANVLVLAHHANDQVETVLLNFFRGCGLDGMTGMKTLEGNKFRPLLGILKTEILSAVKEKKLAYRKDKSNETDEYKRNFVRNRVLPLLEKKWPGIENTLLQNVQRFNSAAKALQSVELSHPIHFEQQFEMDMTVLLHNDLLNDTFRKKAVQAGFHLKEVEKFLQNSKSTESKKLETKTGILERKGGKIRFIPVQNLQQPAKFTIKGNRVSLTIPGAGFTRSRHEKINAASVEGELELRPWKAGDKMIPLGMKGYKKISDLLTDLKLPLSQKQQVYVLCDARKIVWLAGFRIDNRVKINGQEKEDQVIYLDIS